MAELRRTPAASLPGASPTHVTDRAPAPDLARGAMLFVVALANVSGYLYGREFTAGGWPVPGNPVDQLVALIRTDLLVGRGYPLFAALFGYGIVQLSRRHKAADGDPAVARGLIRRRGWWLILFGFLHALLLWSGDILGAYGLIAVAFAGALLRLRERTLLVLACLSLTVVAAAGAISALPLPEGQHSVLVSTAQTNPLVAAGTRLTEWIPSIFLPLGIVGAVLLGVWAGRRRLLENPREHHRFLARTATIGLALAVAGGLPMALIAAALWQPPTSITVIASSLHYVSGFGGLGYAALVALLAIRVRDQHGPVVRALRACGQRSLTCYLAQSVLFVAALAAYGGGLGNRLNLTAATAFAAATWLLTVIAADLMRRYHHRGPAEILLRRLTYRSFDSRTGR